MERGWREVLNDLDGGLTVRNRARVRVSMGLTNEVESITVRDLQRRR